MVTRTSVGWDQYLPARTVNRRATAGSRPGSRLERSLVADMHRPAADSRRQHLVEVDRRMQLGAVDRIQLVAAADNHRLQAVLCQHGFSHSTQPS